MWINDFYGHCFTVAMLPVVYQGGNQTPSSAAAEAQLQFHNRWWLCSTLRQGAPHADPNKNASVGEKNDQKKTCSHIQTADMSCIAQNIPILPMVSHDPEIWKILASMPFKKGISSGSALHWEMHFVLSCGKDIHHWKHHAIIQLQCKYLNILFYTCVYIFFHIRMMCFMKQAHFGHTLAFVGVARVSQETKRTNHWWDQEGVQLQVQTS